MIDDIKVREDMATLQKQIYANDYYVNLYEHVLNLSKIWASDISSRKVRSKDIIRICNAFWMMLPDNNSIRREPFYALCDIAELCFDEDFEDEDNAFIKMNIGLLP